MIYEEIIEKLMTYFTSKKFFEEAKSAKEEFFKIVGPPGGEDGDFEQKMSQFTDWYLFTRQMQGANKTPIELCFEIKAYKIPTKEKIYYQNLLAHRHSLFEFIKIKGEDVHVKDLFSGYRLVLKKSHVSIGFQKEELFETRLIPHEDSFLFARSFCIHPPQASKFIREEVKKLSKNEEPEIETPKARRHLIQRLFKMRCKYEQYRHLGLAEIYSNDTKIPI